ncbi:MAG: polysaccharide pyruvyl transferase family protein, partial [Cyanobacteria bacterium P01_D01_bin.44]
QGLGPLNRATSRWLTRWALQHCDAVSVRDVGSAKLLADWQIGCWLAPDPVWALASKPVPGLWDLPAPRVAVALRPSPSLTPARLALITQALVDFQKTTQTCILLVPFQPVKDLAIAAHVAHQLPGPHQIFQLDDPTQLKGLFRGVEMTIGMRFHALVMSAAEGCRCYALSYDPKVTQLMQDVDIPGCDLLSVSDIKQAQNQTDTIPAVGDIPQNPKSIDERNETSRRVSQNSAPASPSPFPLRPFPNHARTLTQQWLELYVNGQPLTPDQIQSRLDRASIHQALLIDTLVGSDHSGARQNM